MTAMSKIAIGYGIALILLGLVGYFVPETKSPTALIPAAFGIVALLLGLLARKESLRKHVMHGAALLGLLAAVGGGMRGIPGLLRLLGGEEVNRVAVTSQIIMVVLSLVFVALCVKSFIDVRRSRVA